MQPPFGAARPPLDRPELPSFRFPLGAQETHQFNGVDFGPGDVWYFPRGHGHSIQGLGPGTCAFVLVFDNGHFSEFGTFSISDWIGHTRTRGARQEFRPSRFDLRRFSQEKGLYRHGPGTAAACRRSRSGSLNEPPLTHRYRLLAAKPEEFAGGTLRKVSASELPISTTMTGALLIIKPGGIRELHWHPHAAEWQFISGAAGG